MRRGWLGLLAGVAVALLGAGAAAQTRDLTITSWGGAYQDAQRDVFFRPWMQGRGQRLLEETWNGGIDVLRRRAAPGANSWDLVQVEGEQLLIGCAEGLFERIDPAAIGGVENYIPGALHECGVGAVTHAFILAWDRGRTATAPRGWADFFDTARIPGRRALRRGPKTTLEVALLADGVPPAQVYALLATEAGVDRAFRRLDSIRADLAWWERGGQPAQWLAAGEVALALAQHGRIAVANTEDGRDLGMVWAQNLSTMDSWVIMRGSPNVARAVEFLAYVGLPEVQAWLPRRIPLGVTARGAAALLPPELLAQLPHAPRNAATALRLDDAFWLANLDRLARRYEAWLAQ